MPGMGHVVSPQINQLGDSERTGLDRDKVVATEGRRARWSDAIEYHGRAMTDTALGRLSPVATVSFSLEPSRRAP